MKKVIQVFIQSTSVPDFNMIGLFLTFLGRPEVFEKNGSQGPKKEDLKKLKYIPRYSSNLQVCQISACLGNFLLL